MDEQETQDESVFCNYCGAETEVSPCEACFERGCQEGRW